MKRDKLMLSTQIACHLALAAAVKKDNRAFYLILPLVQLTTLFLWLWAFTRALDAVYYTLALKTGQLTLALEITGKLLFILASAIAFGLGVKL